MFGPLGSTPLGGIRRARIIGSQDGSGYALALALSRSAALSAVFGTANSLSIGKAQSSSHVSVLSSGMAQVLALHQLQSLTVLIGQGFSFALASATPTSLVGILSPGQVLFGYGRAQISAYTLAFGNGRASALSRISASSLIHVFSSAEVLALLSQRASGYETRPAEQVDTYVYVFPKNPTSEFSLIDGMGMEFLAERIYITTDAEQASILVSSENSSILMEDFQ